MGVAMNKFAVRETVGLAIGATSLSISCSFLEMWWLKLQLKSWSEMGVLILRPLKWAMDTYSRLRYLVVQHQ